jgi:CRP-like cAMP-binding protein
MPAEKSRDATSSPPIFCTDCRYLRQAPYGSDILRAAHHAQRKETRLLAGTKTFLREGDKAKEIYSLYSGWAFAFRNLANRRRQILRFYIPGDIVVLDPLYFPDRELKFSVSSLTTVSLCQFSADEMARLMTTSSEFNTRVNDIAYRSIALLERKIADLGRRSAAGRMAQLILELEQRLALHGLSDGREFEFPVRQEHLADALGLTAVHVNRTLKGLRRSGQIAFERGRMSIVNVERLRATAEDE